MTVSAKNKSAALKASRASKAVQRLRLFGTGTGPGRDFVVTNPESVTIDETACGETANSGTVKGEYTATKDDSGAARQETVSAQEKLVLTFNKCVAGDTTFDGGPFTLGVGVTVTNNGTTDSPDIEMTFETFLDGKLTATGDEAGVYDFKDFSMKLGPVPLELTDEGDSGAARQTTGQTVRATLNGSFVDGGETFTFNNEIIELSLTELDDALPAEYDSTEDATDADDANDDGFGR